MAGFSLTGLIEQLQKLIAVEPDFLAKLSAFLDTFDAMDDAAIAVLAKWFPNLPAIEKSVIAELRLVISILGKFSPTVLPWVIRGLLFLNSIFGPAPVAGAMMAAPDPIAGDILPGGTYPL